MMKLTDIRKIKKIKKPDTRGWGFTIVLGVLLGFSALIDQGVVNADSERTSPCRVEVTADTLPVRVDAQPSAKSTSTLKRGDLRGATTTVRNGYRQLSDGGWTLDTYLKPLSGSRCTA